MALKRNDFVRRRRAVGFTQEGLAEAMNVERSTVSRWESGKVSPQPYQRPRLAAALQVSVRDLDDLLAVTAEGEAPSTERTR